MKTLGLIATDTGRTFFSPLFNFISELREQFQNSASLSPFSVSALSRNGLISIRLFSVLSYFFNIIETYF